MTRKTPTSRITQWQFFLSGISSATSQNCVIWPYGYLGAGYPSVKDMRTGLVVGGHRLACEMSHGPAPGPKMQAAHRCGNPSCFNPHHLRWATAAQNAFDKKEHGTNNDGERHGLSALSNHQVAKIRADLRGAKRGRQAALAKEYGVSPMTISNIARGKSYEAVA